MVADRGCRVRPLVRINSDHHCHPAVSFPSLRSTESWQASLISDVGARALAAAIREGNPQEEPDTERSIWAYPILFDAPNLIVVEFDGQQRLAGAASSDNLWDRRNYRSDEPASSSKVLNVGVAGQTEGRGVRLLARRLEVRLNVETALSHPRHDSDVPEDEPHLCPVREMQIVLVH